jgi:hypothetical protein
MKNPPVKDRLRSLRRNVFTRPLRLPLLLALGTAGLLVDKYVIRSDVGYGSMLIGFGGSSVLVERWVEQGLLEK